MVPAEPENVHPAPEVTSLEPVPESVDIHASVRALKALAPEPEWKSVITYARGYGVHATQGTPTALVHSLAARFHCRINGRCAVAVYEKPVNGGTWTWRSVWIWGPDLVWYGGCGVTDLKEYLAMARGWSPEELEAWVHGVKVRRIEQEAAREERALTRKAVLAEAKDPALTAGQIARKLYLDVEYVQKIMDGRKATKEVGG